MQCTPIRRIDHPGERYPGNIGGCSGECLGRETRFIGSLVPGRRFMVGKDVA
jgi:hypothetical protein